MVDETELQTQILPEGSIISDRYEILQTIGVGGMGAVYLAADREHGEQQLAMKVLHPHISTDKSYVSRFIREMELMEQIDHPNIVKVFDFGTFESIIYFTMEYVSYPSLETLLDNGKFESRLIPHMIIGIADALDAIHAKDVIHRDLKPGNVLIGSTGKVKIADFGVARPLISNLTLQDQKVGSVSYMAPEIWLSKKLTPAVDYYSLGVMLYEVVTGELPFPDTDDLVELMKQHTRKSVPAPSSIAEALPSWLDKLIIRLLSKNPRSRLRSSKRILEDIRRRFPDTEQEYTSYYDTNNLGLVKSNVKEREFTRLMQADPAKKPEKRRATVVLQMTATRNEPTQIIDLRAATKRRKATLVIPFPKNAAMVLEFETPSTDFICFGIFLASLQIFDGFLTAEGMDRFGTTMEGNPLLQNLMKSYGPKDALLLVKLFAITMVGFLTVAAKRAKWIKNMIAFLSIVYLCAAVLPWLYLLWWRDLLNF